MNSIKCPQCGLVNFASAIECKRCNVKFHAVESSATVSTEAAQAYPYWPARGAVVGARAPDWNAFAKAVNVPVELDPGALEDSAPYTFGMILFAICLLVTIVLLVYQLQQYSAFIRSEEWKVLTNPKGRLYISFFEPLIYFERYSKIGALVASALLFLPFFLKSSLFLKWVRVYLVAGFIYVVVDGWGALLMETEIREKQLGIAIQPAIDLLHAHLYLCVINLLVCYLWFRYFTTSERVKKTFTD